MDNWQLVFTKQAKKDAEKLARTGLAKQANELLNILKSNPYQIKVFPDCVNCS